MKLPLSAAFLLATSLGAAFAGTEPPLRLMAYHESGQRLAKLHDPQSGVTALIGCTQGTLGVLLRYTKTPPLSGDVEVVFHTASGPLAVTGVSLQQKNLVATQQSDANQVNMSKALQDLSQLPSGGQAVMSIRLLGQNGSGDIGTFAISGSGSTRALRPILRECGF